MPVDAQVAARGIRYCLGADGLAGFGAAQAQHVAARRGAAELMVEADHAMHVRSA